MQKWQYWTMVMIYQKETKEVYWADNPKDGTDPTDRLNRAGEDGFELVTINTVYYDDQIETHYALKRPLG